MPNNFIQQVDNFIYSILERMVRKKKGSSNPSNAFAAMSSQKSKNSLKNQTMVRCFNRNYKLISISRFTIMQDFMSWLVEYQIFSNSFIFFCVLSLNISIFPVSAKLLILSIVYYSILYRNDMKIYQSPYRMLFPYNNKKISADEEANNNWKSKVDLMDCRITLQHARVVENQYALFRFTISYGDIKWNTWKRFSELENLRARLTSDYPFQYIPPLALLSVTALDEMDTSSSSVTPSVTPSIPTISSSSSPSTLIFHTSNIHSYSESNQNQMELLTYCQRIMLEWILAVQKDQSIINHSQIRSFLGLPPYKFSNKFGVPLSAITHELIPHEPSIIAATTKEIYRLYIQNIYIYTYLIYDNYYYYWLYI